ncbi:hypothetical protein ACVIWV_001315 [Bradyrhizobium diazoefficiens]|uniref:DUF6894 domain-containing protein n=1 Tax=Bradyrhizobium diazoefficiens TaxID=1355477 RepID=A0A810A3H9_9BRAD|nr:hypothetical protein [Bradyrhizobium diazoefficiens]MBR0867690.1 hypothetical protein [Bradyrhizobium diazoefficiens]MBR0892218.1 hypothetical protein [Bradyrhizobium diazoefficiens]MBR0923936.1 hypothetical protein [Bradyrhizobium diazoefficiens]QJS41090.1 hypothetical protein DI395_46435 [Bradyrhizobium diazoefficiens]WLA67893.1 hypothetical protein QNN01_15190 [Bradyrhizobium diazoefficiens]
MPLYSFKLINTRLVSDFGVHELPGEAEAQIEAIRLARSLRETRPELIGHHYSVSVINDDGAAVCTIPLDNKWAD